MPIEVFLPRLTHDMHSGIFVGWLKQEGDRVARGEPLFEVETDKAVTEIAAEADGILHATDFHAGDEIPIGTVIAYLLAEGETPPDIREGSEPSAPAAPVHGQTLRHPGRVEPAPDVQAHPDDRVIASPIARRIAREKGVDLRQLSGSGPRGRILEADVRSFLHRPPEQGPASGATTERIPLTRIQAITGERMALSSQTIPQFTLEVDVDMGEIQRLRQQPRGDGERPPSYTAVFVKVIAEALEAHPRVNARWEDGFIEVYRDINVGVALAAADGLLVPVIHRANRLRLRQIQAALDDIRGQVRGGQLPPQALAGGTFTLSNLGMYGVDRFQALVNPPQAAILAAGRIRDLPWIRSGGIQVRPILTLRMSADHRVLDGAIAAPFLAAVKDLLENPNHLLWTHDR